MENAKAQRLNKSGGRGKNSARAVAKRQVSKTLSADYFSEGVPKAL